MRVGLAFNLKRVKPGFGGVNDEEAEYDAPSTVETIASAIHELGHDVVLLEADRTFPNAVMESRVDVVFNVSEGKGGRHREANVPAVLELLEIPYTGSDPASLVMTLDKAVAKAIVRGAGVRAPKGVVMFTGDEELPSDFRFPAIVKPVAEGSSKGVLPASVARSKEEARPFARRLAARYAQGALVEEYLPGRELTLALLGDPPTLLPPMEVVFHTKDPFPVYSFDHKLEPTSDVTYEAPARLSDALERELRELAFNSFTALGCRDVARIDVRLDDEGHPSFIECNPLPGLVAGWSDLCLIADAAGIDYTSLIGHILNPAIRRARSAGAGRASRHES